MLPDKNGAELLTRRDRFWRAVAIMHTEAKKKPSIGKGSLHHGLELHHWPRKTSLSGWRQKLNTYGIELGHLFGWDLEATRQSLKSLAGAYANVFPKSLSEYGFLDSDSDITTPDLHYYFNLKYSTVLYKSPCGYALCPCSAGSQQYPFADADRTWHWLSS